MQRHLDESKSSKPIELHRPKTDSLKLSKASKQLIRDFSKLTVIYDGEVTLESVDLKLRLSSIILQKEREIVSKSRQIQIMIFAIIILVLILPLLMLVYRNVRSIKEYIFQSSSSIKQSLDNRLQIKLKEMQVENDRINRELINQIEMNEKLHFKVARELESQVKLRTEEITAQNEEITAQRDELEKKQLIINQKNKDLLDSIHYARRIQNASLAGRAETISHFKEAFIFYEPKDIVSGDFYWFSVVDNLLLFAIADCTGHGVPGAVLTMLGNSILNQIILKDKETEPSKILEKLDSELINSFGKEGQAVQISDGMDLALCCIDLVQSKLFFSGARNPLYYFRGGQMHIVSPTPRSIGCKNSSRPFNTVELQVQKDDVFYMFTDGYYDQFGGANGKKFMKSRFRKTLMEISEQPLNAQKESLKQKFNNWKGGLEQTDDILIAGFKI